MGGRHPAASRSWLSPGVHRAQRHRLHSDVPDARPAHRLAASAHPRVRGQYFRGIALDVWEFHVGGYQVCEKWLKDRRGQALSLADIERYQRIVAAIGRTIQLMVKIDALMLPTLAEIDYVAAAPDV